MFLSYFILVMHILAGSASAFAGLVALINLHYIFIFFWFFAGLNYVLAWRMFIDE